MSHTSLNKISWATLAAFDLELANEVRSKCPDATHKGVNTDTLASLELSSGVLSHRRQRLCERFLGKGDKTPVFQPTVLQEQRPPSSPLQSQILSLLNEPVPVPLKPSGKPNYAKAPSVVREVALPAQVTRCTAHVGDGLVMATQDELLVGHSFEQAQRHRLRRAEDWGVRKNGTVVVRTMGSAACGVLVNGNQVSHLESVMGMLDLQDDGSITYRHNKTLLIIGLEGEPTSVPIETYSHHHRLLGKGCIAAVDWPRTIRFYQAGTKIAEATFGGTLAIETTFACSDGGLVARAVDTKGKVTLVRYTNTSKELESRALEYKSLTRLPNGQFLNWDEGKPATIYSENLEPIGTTTLALGQVSTYHDGRLVNVCNGVATVLNFAD